MFFFPFDPNFPKFLEESWINATDPKVTIDLNKVFLPIHNLYGVEANDLEGT